MTEENAFTTLEVDGLELPIRRLSFSSLRSVLQDPGLYHANIFGVKEQTKPMILGSMIHHLLLESEAAPFPYGVDYAPKADTLITNDDLFSAIDDIMDLPEGVRKPPRKGTKKADLIEFLRVYHPEAHSRVESVEQHEFGKNLTEGITLVPADLIRQAEAAAEYAKVKLGELTAQVTSDGEGWAMTNERKLITDTETAIGEETFTVPFSAIPDMIVSSTSDTEKPVSIVEVKTFSMGSTYGSRYMSALYWKLRKMDIAGQLHMMRVLLELSDRPVKYHVLAVPTDKPENTAIVHLNEAWVSAEGGAFLNRSLTKWLECVRRFSGLREDIPWSQVDTVFHIDERGDIYAEGEEKDPTAPSVGSDDPGFAQADDDPGF